MSTEPTGTDTFEGETVSYITITPSKEARQSMLLAFLSGELDGLLADRRRYRKSTAATFGPNLQALAKSLARAANTAAALIATFDTVTTEQE